MSAPFSLEVEGLVKHFPVRGGFLQRQRGAWCSAVDGITLHHLARGDLGPGRRVRAAARPR